MNENMPNPPQTQPPTAYIPPVPPLPPVPPALPQGAPAALPALKKSPGLAGFLSLLPGVGHVYLGLYQRAVIFFAIWVMAIAIASNSSGPAGVIIPFWMLFVLIDAVRQTHAINATGLPESNLISGEPQFKIQGNLAFGVFMILFGVFFLIDRFVKIDLTWLFEWWQIPVIAFGAWQVYLYFRGKKDAENETSGPDTGILP